MIPTSVHAIQSQPVAGERTIGNVIKHLAHTRPANDSRPPQELSEHLERVADLAAGFAPEQLVDLARTAGRWHDAGKYQAAFQRYILANPKIAHGSGAIAPRSLGVPHAAAGAALALERFGEDTPEGLFLALVIEAHHGALKPLHDVVQAVARRGPALLLAARSGGLPSKEEQQHPIFKGPPTAMAVRMLFSALVDADLLDTEAWDIGKGRPDRGEPLHLLRDRLDALCAAKMEQSRAAASTPAEQALHRMRSQVYEECVAAAFRNRQSFTLTVPTGGGKTLSGLAFALHHAVHHRMRRVIVVAPYTTILEQTADVYRSALGAENVIEHHSNLNTTEDTDRNRQAFENWDAPVIVTTSVQLLESLHAAHKRACRKLHRIADTVVLLDEVQTFPAALLQPIHAALQRLVREFGVTVVHGTATQPLLASPAGGSARKSLPAELTRAMSEIVALPARHFDAVRHRFTLEVLGDLDTPVEPAVLAEDARQQVQAMIITHLRNDARQLADLLGPECLHLSAAMCAEHRTVILDEVRGRLQRGERCLLVSTQLIEAGVDIDFPVVYRAMAGLDALAQAAGRCNRAMQRTVPGRFVVYRAASNPPPGTPRLGMTVGLAFFKRGHTNLSDPALFPRYTREVLEMCGTDAKGLIGLEEKMNFPEVAANFRMIDEPTISVVAPYGAGPGLVAELRRLGPTRDRFRALQRFTVGLRKNAFDALYRAGWLEPALDSGKSGEPLETLWTVRDGDSSVYDPRFGFPVGEKDTKLRPLIG